MVFARCPAGTDYQLGISNADLTYVANGDANAQNYKTAMGLKTVTFTSDWYIGIYMITEAQHALVKDGSSNNSYAPKYVSYNGLRGATNDNPSVNWPSTKYYVSPSSFVGKMRKLVGDSLWIDLPQESQWEVAVRAGTSTFWSTGGTSSDSLETLTNYVQRLMSYDLRTKTFITTEVGCAEANTWGIYDPVTSSCLVLDTVALVGNKNYPSSAQIGGTDPVGSYVSAGNYIGRVVRLSGSSLWEHLPMGRYATRIRTPGTTDPGGLGNNAYYARLAIHLKPLNFRD